MTGTAPEPTRWEILASRVLADQERQFPIEPDHNWVLALLEDMHDLEQIEEPLAEDHVANAVYERIARVYDDTDAAAGTFTRWRDKLAAE